MTLSGVEVPFAMLNHVEQNTVYVVISDENGDKKIYKVDHDSIPADEPLLRVSASTLESGAQTQSGCWVRNNGGMVWKDPCP